MGGGKNALFLNITNQFQLIVMVDHKDKIRFIDVVNNPSSRVVLICIRSYTTENPKIIPSVSYRAGQLLPRNEVYLNPANWRIASNRDSRKFMNGRKEKFLSGLYN